MTGGDRSYGLQSPSCIHPRGQVEPSRPPPGERMDIRDVVWHAFCTHEVRGPCQTTGAWYGSGCILVGTRKRRIPRRRGEKGGGGRSVHMQPPPPPLRPFQRTRRLQLAKATQAKEVNMFGPALLLQWNRFAMICTSSRSGIELF